MVDMIWLNNSYSITSVTFIEAYKLSALMYDRLDKFNSYVVGIIVSVVYVEKSFFLFCMWKSFVR